MNHEIILKLGQSCYATFNFTKISSDKKAVTGYIELHVPNALGGNVFRSIEKSILVEDWDALCKYFDKHIVDQQVDYPKSSHVFLTYDLQFKIQAGAGDVISDTEGTFALWFMIDIGDDPISKRRIFIGLDVLVYVSHIREFISSIRELLAEVENK